VARKKSKDKKNRLRVYLFKDTCAEWDDVLENLLEKGNRGTQH